MTGKYCKFLATGSKDNDRIVIGSNKCLSQPHENCEDCWVGEQFKELKTNLKKAIEERDFLIKYLGGLECPECPCRNEGKNCAAQPEPPFFNCEEAVGKWMTDKMEEAKKNERCD